MMMRSMPPASSALAERPVPAPPPTIGWPRAIMSRNFSRILARAMAGICSSACLAASAAGNLLKSRHCGLGEFRVVDVQRQAFDPTPWRLMDSHLKRREQRGIGIRIPESAAFDVQRRHTFFRNEETHRPLAGVELFSDPFADRMAFLSRPAHQRHVWIV